MRDRIQSKCCNPTNPEILKTVKSAGFEWDMKFYFLHMKSNEVGTTLKHPETINGWNHSQTLPLIASAFGQILLKKNFILHVGGV
jgi:hypothetical protein